MSSWRLEDVFASCLPKTSSKRLQYVVARLLLQDLFKKMFCKHFLKKSWRCLGRQKNVTLKTSLRRLEDIFNTSSTHLHQDECLLGNDRGKSSHQQHFLIYFDINEYISSDPSFSKKWGSHLLHIEYGHISYIIKIGWYRPTWESRKLLEDCKVAVMIFTLFE